MEAAGVGPLLRSGGVLPHKTKLERHLKQRYGELFGAEFDVLLYDLTSTYVEGAAARRVGSGYSIAAS